MKPDLTIVITGHQEGRLAVASLRAFSAALAHVRESGFTCQPIWILDRPNQLTQQLFEEYAEDGNTVAVVDFGDQGKTRNAAIENCKGRYTAFLDADDIWTKDWLTKALTFLSESSTNTIAHPEFNYFFEKQATIFLHVDQESDLFEPALLRLGNYWDALCVCPTDIYREIPFSERDIKNGWAYEDWYWNCETVAAGFLHKIVPGTVLFKRRQETSQTIKASENKSMVRANSLSRYRGKPSIWTRQK